MSYAERENMNFRKPSLVDAITNELLRRIARGEYKEGQKIPPQKKLARDLGVSTVSLRGSLDQLSMMGFIEARQGRGTFVMSTKPSLLVKHPVILMDKAMTWELLEARMKIECLLAAMAAQRASQQDVQSMRTLLAVADEDMGANRTDDFGAKDLEFHLMIARACRNRVMTKILESLREPVQQLITDIYAVSPDSLEQSNLEHKEILDAIAIHEVEKAQERMEAHLQTSKRLIERYYRFKEIDVL